jgi:hypothetical protein
MVQRGRQEDAWRFTGSHIQAAVARDPGRNGLQGGFVYPVLTTSLATHEGHQPTPSRGMRWCLWRTAPRHLVRRIVASIGPTQDPARATPRSSRDHVVPRETLHGASTGAYARAEEGVRGNEDSGRRHVYGRTSILWWVGVSLDKGRSAPPWRVGPSSPQSGGCCASAALWQSSLGVGSVDALHVRMEAADAGADRFT